MHLIQRSRTLLLLLLSFVFAFNPTVEVEAGQKLDRKALRKFGGLYVGTWQAGGTNLPVRISMPRKGKGGAVGTFEATPLDSGDAQAPLRISIQKVKLSRNGKVLTSIGIATWERSRVPQWGGPNQSGPFRVKAKLAGKRPRAIGFMQIGAKSGHVTVGVRGFTPSVPTPWMEFVFVGNPNNPNDPNDGDAPLGGVQNFGSVANDFLIGKYEVTNTQYIEFLNAVAKTDTNGLFHPDMGTNERAGIIQNGSTGSFVYALKRPALAEKPAVLVSFWNACRFCNWLHNGKPTGLQGADTTENGAYDLTIPDVISNNTAARKLQAKYFVPSNNEWYKAAYHQPAALGGDVDHYWLYPTKSNSIPDFATADSSGNINNATSNIANHDNLASWFTGGGNVTTVGSGGNGSSSFYKAFDMAGNVWEWNDTVATNAAGRYLRGGSWFDGSIFLRAMSYNGWSTGPEGTIGFRIARPVP